MITIPKKVEYTVELIAYLSQRKGEVMSLTQISGNLKLPYRFLGQLALPLKEAGILQSREGKNGGYTLSLGWNKKTLYDLLVALREDKHLVKCLGRGCICGRQQECRVRNVWKKVEITLIKEFKKVKLGEI